MTTTITRTARLMVTLTFVGFSSLLAHNAFAQSPLFQPLYEVLTHPRCMNCHTITDFPRQGDERRRHAQLVVRGTDNHGAPTLQCSACHQDENVADDAVPGAPHWGLAPLSMGWEGLNASQLCQALKDSSKNGNRSLADLLKHMSEDSLVLWAWTPGGNRSTPPLSQPAFVEAVQAWVNAGGPC
ncbi:hypothetical protein [Zhongshania aliphaticivorans]|uniref:hypothetical protein n=1 Tax=Zhongshania aliphaticivorans TaxID=1470434 RepID=UPI0012E6998B|nr:hypothetical protein [Zhongshania aliphaticivorans]CAA0097598.1 Uncharacterised protein [Zhongshania aliphaticivorans]